VTDREMFEKALCETRYNHDLRRIYADWLEEQGEDDGAAWQRHCATSEWKVADRWLVEFARSLGGTGGQGEAEEDYGSWHEITLDELVQIGRDWLENGEYVQLGSEHARDLMHDDTVRLKFWECWQAWTGEYVADDQKGVVFSCSC
jgi:uncharacterized protein (TIGR02996 family)